MSKNFSSYSTKSTFLMPAKNKKKIELISSEENEEAKKEYLSIKNIMNEPYYDKYLDCLSKDILQQMKALDIKTVYAYFVHLDELQFNKEDIERRKFGLTWDQYNKWKYPENNAKTILIDGLPAIRKGKKIIWIKNRPRINSIEDDIEERIMKNIIDGHGDLEGL